MKINLIENKEILDFEKEIGYELEANERPNSISDRFYVSFSNAEKIEGCLLRGSCGNGNSIDEALKDYCLQISNQIIAFDSFTDKRKNIQMPKLIHTKLLGL